MAFVALVNLKSGGVRVNAGEVYLGPNPEQLVKEGLVRLDESLQAPELPKQEKKKSKKKQG